MSEYIKCQQYKMWIAVRFHQPPISNLKRLWHDHRINGAAVPLIQALRWHLCLFIFMSGFVSFLLLILLLYCVLHGVFIICYSDTDMQQSAPIWDQTGEVVVTYPLQEQPVQHTNTSIKIKDVTRLHSNISELPCANIFFCLISACPLLI